MSTVVVNPLTVLSDGYCQTVGVTADGRLKVDIITCVEPHSHSDLEQLIQDLYPVLDGYTGATDLTELINAINTILQDLDGYAILSVENQRWADSSQQRQDIRDALDGYSEIGSVLFWGNEKVGASATTRYLSPGYNEHNAEVVATQFRSPVTGTIQKMYVRQNNGLGNGNNITYTLRVNSVASPLSVTMASTANDGSNLVNTVSVSEGDLLDIRVTKAAWVGVSPRRIVVTMEIV